MSELQTTKDIDRMVLGFDTPQAVELVLSYIQKNHHFLTAKAAHDFWAERSDDEKVDILVKALRK